MKSLTRARILRWLFFVGPTASLLLVAVGALFLAETRAGEGFQLAITRATATGPLSGASILPNFTFAALGWLLLTLCCSAGSCLRTFRRLGKTGRTLVIWVALTTPLLAVAHIALGLGILFSGCLAIYGPIRS